MVVVADDDGVCAAGAVAGLVAKVAVVVNWEIHEEHASYIDTFGGN